MSRALNWEKDRIRQLIKTSGRKPASSGGHFAPADPVLCGIMPFGKHRGRRISCVPTDYLEWLYGVLEPDRYRLKKKLSIELAKRRSQQAFA